MKSRRKSFTNHDHRYSFLSSSLFRSTFFISVSRSMFLFRCPSFFLCLLLFPMRLPRRGLKVKRHHRFHCGTRGNYFALCNKTDFKISSKRAIASEMQMRLARRATLMIFITMRRPVYISIADITYVRTIE